MSEENTSEVIENEPKQDDEKKFMDVEFAKPMPVSAPKPDKFKKPILIGPRKGHKKNPIISNSSLNKIMELNAKFAESRNQQVKPEEEVALQIDQKEIEPPQEVLPKIEIPSGPLIIKDFSDKVLPPEFPYTEPPWKGIPDDKYFLEELKSGVIEKEIDLCDRSFTVLGRIDHCHIMMAHPTVSRYHAVLQYRATRQGIYDKGFYLYDLGSTHGTFLNKNRIKPQTYIRIQVGHVMKFGCSTRMFILQGPNIDQEPESEFSVTELKEMRKQELIDRERKKEEEEQAKKAEELRLKEELESRGVDWGMSEDADEEEDLSENPYAATTNEELYAEDPKKELKKWFEREGEELNFETEMVERGKIVCRITLPLEDGKGGEVNIESTGKSKKEATSACALEACRYIDRMGMFRQSNQESRKRQIRNWEENDYYDSDEDTYFDRTGDVDEKRQKRMKKAGKVQETVETYESLVESHEALLKKIAEAEKKFAEMTHAALAGSKMSSAKDLDELDEYMHSLKRNVPNKLEIRICQVELNNLKEEETRLVSLINLARPASLPALKPYVPPKASVSTTSVQDGVPLDQKNIVPSSSGKSEKMEVNSEHVSSSDKLDSHLDTQKKVEKISPAIHKAVELDSKPVIGPTLPPTQTMNETVKKPKRNRNRQRERNQKMAESDQFDSTDYSDLTWQPPQDQTGDGRTSLNDKYGY